MKLLVSFVLATFAVGALSQCTCPTLKWGMCDASPCVCTHPVDQGVKLPLDCNKLIPKCFLMKIESYRARNQLSTRTGIGGKPVETAIVDNDGIYDPDCEVDGKFKARQCNNTDVCWCVNSAGVRRTDKGDQNLKCDELVETYWVRLELTHKPFGGVLNQANLQSAMVDVMQKRYNFTADSAPEVQYDQDARKIVVDVKKPVGDRRKDLPRMAYYMEKDIKALPLFLKTDPFQATVAGQPLQMENIIIYYVDEKGPTFTMKQLTKGVIAVIVVVILLVVAGLIGLYFLRRRERAQYSKAQAREMENM
ncbi:epithelial cell adhesion molecule [Denticeps clupeoides]|uniref:Thyroglobulin type-1 domain-containing protein n=1 Tax=Denticeps clupeoides TaxID=299321 RepID=A0AAY4DCC2_9TELE|nr:tumor-associated calcium signal transducer 2-like [Denticeps clupeoides]